MIGLVAFLLRLDEAILERVQKYIADPLQHRGLPLYIQYYIVSSVMVLAMITDAVLRPTFGNVTADGILILAGLSDMFVWGNRRPERLSPPPNDQALNRNILKFAGALPRIVLTFVFSFILTVELAAWATFGRASLSYRVCWLIWCVGTVLTHYLDACDPKPPRPKRQPALSLAHGQV